MKIQSYDGIPDKSYFTISDVSPFISFDDPHTIIIYNGVGSHRTWGSPQVQSAIVYHDEHFVAIHVGYSHKHHGSQGWFYFVNFERKKWAALTNEQRVIVLANLSSAPHWARNPGNLKKQK